MNDSRSSISWPATHCAMSRTMLEAVRRGLEVDYISGQFFIVLFRYQRPMKLRLHSYSHETAPVRQTNASNHAKQGY